LGVMSTGSRETFLSEAQESKPSQSIHLRFVFVLGCGLSEFEGSHSNVYRERSPEHMADVRKVSRQ
jgi:hypothetical protein